MEIVKNLAFQEKFFQEIYQSYFTQRAVEATEEEPVSSSPEIRDKILIYTDDFSEVLRDVFHLPDSEKELQKYNDFSEIIIQDKRVESREIDSFHHSCLLELTHIYRLKHYRVTLVKKLSRKSMNGVCKVIVLKPLDLFSKRAMKGVPYLDFSKESSMEKKMEVVQGHLHHFKNYYDERKSIEDSLATKTELMNDQIRELLDDFDSVLGLEVVNQIISNPNRTSKSQFTKYKKRILQEFQGYALPILESLMTKDSFARNFQLIEIYFENELALQARLNVILDEEMLPHMKKSREQEMSHIELLIETLEKYAGKIDEELKETVFAFKNAVLDIFQT